MRAALERPDAVVLPSSQSMAQKTLLSLKPRELPRVAECEPVADVENRVSSIQFRPGLVQAEPFTRRVPVGGGRAAVPSGACVNRVAPSVVHSKHQLCTHRPADGSL